MNRKNIHVLNGIIISFLVLVMLGCGGRLGDKTATNGKQQSAEYSSDGTMQDGMLEIVDIVGRTVTVPTGDIKVVLGSNMMIHAIAPLFGKNGNPFKHIIGWNNNNLGGDHALAEIYLKQFPEISAISTVGHLYRGDFSIEKVISLNPDILFLESWTLGRAQEAKLIEKLEKVGIKTVFVEFGDHPIRYVIPGILLLGQIFQKATEAINFANFYSVQMQKVYSVVDKIEKEMKRDEKPLVFLEAVPSATSEKVGEYSPFGSVGLGSLVELAGGRNYGTEAFGSKSPIVSAEQMFVINPDVIIGTGLHWSKKKQSSGAVLLGYKATTEDAQRRLKNIVTSRSGWETLKAVKNKRVHSTLHMFKNSPYYFIPVQQMAKWIYPEKFAHLNPEETFKEFHDKFLPIEYSGIFGASLE